MRDMSDTMPKSFWLFHTIMMCNTKSLPYAKLAKIEFKGLELSCTLFAGVVSWLILKLTFIALKWAMKEPQQTAYKKDPEL